ncbi:MAG TPA: Hsp20/alpha crystallin family protein [Vicinamibacterales bacterium]|nr:Hsp20/alpha crystallin family protein [Vicinamibacterales bacterium]
MTLTRWNPVNDLAAVEIDRLNRMFDAAFSGELTSGGWVPAADVYETEGQDVVVKIELPDVKREDIKVTVENNVLTVAGERKFDASTKRDQYHRIERGYGAFHRSFSLSTAVDAARVSATCQDGVLTVTLPRREETRPRQIQVNG